MNTPPVPIISATPTIPDRGRILMRPAPPSGIYLQPYLGAIRGGPSAVLSEVGRISARAQSVGVRGIVLHGFPRGMARNFDAYASQVTSHGLLALASWGLDGERDEDGTVLTAREKGQLCGSVAARLSCVGSYLDAEGKYDSSTGPTDDTSERGALEFGEEFRKVAPTAWLGDQPWFAIDSHGDLNVPTRPMNAGGVFRGFPVDEFAVSCVNGDRARQAYWADFYRTFGREAYRKVIAWMDRDWAKIRPAMQAAGLARTEAVTTQGYGHPEPTASIDLVDCFLEWAFVRATRTLVWCEYEPEENVWRSIAAAVKLGATCQAVDSAHNIVARFQASVGLAADGLCGPATMHSLGV